MTSFFNDKENKNNNKRTTNNHKLNLNSEEAINKPIKSQIKILIATIKILKLIWLLIFNLHYLNFSLSLILIAKRIFIDPLFLSAKASLSLILLSLRISKLLMKLLLVLILLKLLNFTETKKPQTKSTQEDFQSIISSNQNFYANLNKEYSSFLKQYEKNSCIMQVFNNAKLNCNAEKTEETNSLFAYKMTECYFNSVGKQIPECKKSQNLLINNDSSFTEIKNCIKKLKGDAWTTFTNFQNHIDNLCFFHKTLIWEKSSDFIYSKMLNSTVGILAELSQGSNLAKRILLEQEKFSSQLKDNMTDTLEEFKKIQTYFESFEKLEAKIKNDMLFIEQKINKNNKHLINTLKKLSSNFNYIDGFFFDSKGGFVLKFYVFLFVCAFVFCFNSNVGRFKIKLFMLILFFLCCEKFLFRNFNSTASEASEYYKPKKNLIEFNSNLEEEIKNDFVKNYFHNEKNNNNNNNNKTDNETDDQTVKEKFEIFESLKYSFATLLNSTFPLDGYLVMNKENNFNFFSFNYFESFVYCFYLYSYRLVCFIILNVICCLLKNNPNKKEKDKNYYEKIMHSDYKNGYFSSLSNSKSSITPLWMRKYFSRIQDKNEELLERFKVLKIKLDKGNNSLAATPSIKY